MTFLGSLNSKEESTLATFKALVQTSRQNPRHTSLSLHLRCGSISDCPSLQATYLTFIISSSFPSNSFFWNLIFSQLLLSLSKMTELLSCLILEPDNGFLGTLPYFINLVELAKVSFASFQAQAWALIAASHLTSSSLHSDIVWSTHSLAMQNAYIAW